jgi:hypothetical protein
LHLHEDCRDGNQQADKKDTTEDTKLRIDGQMTNQGQLALAAPVDHWRRTAGRAIWARAWSSWASRRVGIGLLLGRAGSLLGAGPF